MTTFSFRRFIATHDMGRVELEIKAILRDKRMGGE